MNRKDAFARFVIAMRERFAFSSPAVNHDCSEFEVNNRIISRFILKKLVPIVGIHPFPLNEQMLIVSAVCRLQPTHIFEWGTNVGKSARIFYETCRIFKISSEIHSIDLPDDTDHAEHPRGKRGLLVRGKKGVHLHLGDGLATSLQILSQIRSAKVQPLFFLDGDHSYESVRRELEGIINDVPYADILVHDTFYQSGKSGYNIGPYEAIQDTLNNSSGKFRMLSQNLGLPGLTLIMPSKDNK